MKKIVLLFAIFAFGLQLVMAQTREITGKVTSADDGKSIPGVSVSVKGTTLGTITNAEGNYTISVPLSTRTLVFSFVGMKTLEAAITGTTVNARLQSEVLDINEVVVTAMGITRDAKSLGYAYQEVDSDELMKTGSPDMAKALQGKLSGVDIKLSSGMPGASSQFVIRGARSFSGDNTPLYVIDGMPVESNAYFSTYTKGNGSVGGADISNRALDINPNDIESINVMKGQAAAALYGLRASNGVVIITTKSGKGGERGKTIVTVNQTTSFDVVSRTPDFQTTWAQGVDRGYVYNSSMSWGPKITNLPDDPTYGGNSNGHEGMYYVPQLEDAGYDEKDCWVYPKAYNNWKDYFQTGVTSTSSVNVSKNEATGSFSLGLAYTYQDGIALNTGMERWNAKASAEKLLNNNFTVGFSANFSQTEIDKLSGANDGSLAGVLAAPSSYNLKGMPYKTQGDPYTQIYYRGLTFDNPYWVAENNTFNEVTQRFFGNGFVEFKTPLSHNMNLTVKYQLGADTYTSHYQDIFGYGSKGGKGIIDNYGVTVMTYNSLATANYNWDISDDFKFNLILGNELDHRKEKTYRQYGEGFNFGGWNHIQNASTTSPEERQWQYRTVGFFGSASLSFREMLFLTATGRQDYASRMPRNNRTFFYPSVSLGFVASELDFIKDVSWLDFVKLRGSYAEVGQADNYREDYYYSPSYSGSWWNGNPIIYPIDGVNSYIQYPIKYDPALKPQNTKSYEIGLNLNMFKNRIGLDYTYSRQNVEDQIFEVPLAGSTGKGSLVTNGGKVHTNSHEFTLSLVPVQVQNFTWDVRVNFYKFENVVDELKEGVTSIYLGGFVTPQVRAGIGDTYPVIYGSSFAKDDKGRRLVSEDPNDPGYGMPMSGETKVIGSVSPDFILGGSTNFTYKNISLGATFEWKNGGCMYSGTNGLMDSYGMSARTEDRESTFIYKGYKADGTPNDIARGGPNDPGAYQTLFSDVLSSVDEHFIQGNSFVKLRELSLKYMLPKSLIPKVEVSVSGFARNILLWTELDNADPESSQGNDNMMGSFERFSVPQTMSFGFGVEVKF